MRTALTSLVFSQPAGQYLESLPVYTVSPETVTLCLPYLVDIVRHTQNATLPPYYTSFSSPCLLSFLLPSLHRPRLCCFLPITPYHDHTQKAPHDRRSEKDKNDWYSNSPDAGRKEVVEGVALVDEGLGAEVLAYAFGHKGKG